MERYLMIAAGGAAGALARYQVAASIQSRIPSTFPWGTFVVNISGCLIMGFVMAVLAQKLSADQNWRFLLPIGFIGAYTTFSTFEFETYRAMTDGAWLVAGGNVLASVVAGFIALWLGSAVARLI